jgi:hypothetical protein
MNQPATQIATDSPAFHRDIREQLAKTRNAVSAGEDKRLRDAVHPARWERRGFFRRLRRRPGLSEVA